MPDSFPAQAVQANVVPFAQAALVAAGYSCLADNVAVGYARCEVWERENPDHTPGAQCPPWTYVVVAEDQQGKRFAINPDEPLVTAPHVMALARVLLQGGFLDRDPPLSYEWAFAQNRSNDSPSNFPARELRDRAVDELFVDGCVEADDTIVLFEIYPNGDQDESASEYIELAKWVSERDLSAFVTNDFHHGAPVTP